MIAIRLLALALSVTAATPKVRPVVVEAGRIRVHDKHGGFLPDAKLIGAKLVGYNDAGIPIMFRVASSWSVSSSPTIATSSLP